MWQATIHSTCTQALKNSLLAAGANSSSSQVSDQTQLNGTVTSKPQKSSAAGKGKKEEARAVDLSLLSLKVGVIRSAERHPDADTLYVEQVDCGEEQPRTVEALAFLFCDGTSVFHAPDQDQLAGILLAGVSLQLMESDSFVFRAPTTGIRNAVALLRFSATTAAPVVSNV